MAPQVPALQPAGAHDEQVLMLPQLLPQLLPQELQLLLAQQFD